MTLRPGGSGCGALVALWLAVALPTTASAQPHEWVALGGTVSVEDIRMEGFGIGPEKLTGLLYGVEGRATWWRLYAQGEFRQGRLAQDHLDGSSTRVVSARASVGVRVLPGIVVAGGPRWSSVGTPGGTRRILRWRAEVIGNAPLIPHLASGFASVAGSVAGTDVDGLAGFEGGSGEVGLLVAPAERPVWARIGYRLERELLLFGSSHTAETAFLSIGVSVPRLDERWERP